MERILDALASKLLEKASGTKPPPTETRLGFLHTFDPNKPYPILDQTKKTMSFLGIGARQPSSEEKVKAVESEMRLLADMLNRMTKACTIKCIGQDYREGELNKGEAVCLDRCAAKFFDTHMKISELMQKESQERGGGSPF